MLIDYAGNCWFTTGFGIYRTQNLSGTPAQWVAQMDNLEELVVNIIKAPPVAGGAALISGTADMIGFVHADYDSVPRSTLMPDQFGYGSSIAYCESKPSVVAFVGSDQSNGIGKAQYSLDNGKTWSNFATTPAGAFNGNIAISATDPKRMVWAPTAADWTSPAKITAYYTTDGGNKWTICTGLPAVNDASLQWSTSQFLTSDKVNGNTFYYYDPGFWPAPTGVVYRSIDGGVSWSQVKTGLPQFYRMKLESVPGKQGHVWFSTHSNDALHISKDSGSTWEAVDSVHSISFGFGKAIAPSTEPTAFLYGTISGKTGMFRSTDYGRTWTAIGINVLPDNITDITGDMRNAGRVLVGTSGRGIFRGEDLLIGTSIFSGSTFKKTDRSKLFISNSGKIPMVNSNRNIRPLHVYEIRGRLLSARP
ncbi:MAG: hypothetical protein M3Y08_11330 [Fibrobacterota bacterium]|nr:hypothetical protein [Fibrobacterota bacterium]